MRQSVVSPGLRARYRFGLRRLRRLWRELHFVRQHVRCRPILRQSAGPPRDASPGLCTERRERLARPRLWRLQRKSWCSLTDLCRWLTGSGIKRMTFSLSRFGVLFSSRERWSPPTVGCCPGYRHEGAQGVDCGAAARLRAVRACAGRGRAMFISPPNSCHDTTRIPERERCASPGRSRVRGAGASPSQGATHWYKFP